MSSHRWKRPDRDRNVLTETDITEHWPKNTLTDFPAVCHLRDIFPTLTVDTLMSPHSPWTHLCPHTHCGRTYVPQMISLITGQSIFTLSKDSIFTAWTDHETIVHWAQTCKSPPTLLQEQDPPEGGGWLLWSSLSARQCGQTNLHRTQKEESPSMSPSPSLSLSKRPVWWLFIVCLFKCVLRVFAVVRTGPSVTYQS